MFVQLTVPRYSHMTHFMLQSHQRIAIGPIVIRINIDYVVVASVLCGSLCPIRDRSLVLYDSVVRKLTVKVLVIVPVIHEQEHLLRSGHVHVERLLV